MRIQPTNNNSVSHKAYFVPNSNFKILHGMEIKKAGINLTELKKLRELPNHPLEILEMKKEFVYGNLTGLMCTIFNAVTKQTRELRAFAALPMSSLMCKINELKGSNFFEETALINDSYKALSGDGPVSKALEEILTHIK